MSIISRGWTDHWPVTIITDHLISPSFCNLSYNMSIDSSKRVSHSVLASVPSFNFQYPLVCWRSSISCLRLRPSLPVNSILPSIIPSITCSRWQFLRKMLPKKLAFFFIHWSLQNLELCPTYGRQHNFSERSSFSVVTLTVGQRLFSCVSNKMLICHQARSKFSSGPNSLWSSLPFHPKTQTDPVPETCSYWHTTGFPKFTSNYESPGSVPGPFMWDWPWTK